MANILLHAGDMTDDGTYDELEKALRLDQEGSLIIETYHSRYEDCRPAF